MVLTYNNKLKTFDSKFFLVEFKQLITDLIRVKSSLSGGRKIEESEKTNNIAPRLDRLVMTFKGPVKWLKILFKKKSPDIMDNTTYYEIKELMNEIEVELPQIKDLDVGNKSNKKALLKVYKLLNERLFFLHSNYNNFARNSHIAELEEIHLVDFSNRSKLYRVK